MTAGHDHVPADEHTHGHRDRRDILAFCRAGYRTMLQNLLRRLRFRR